MKSNKVKGFTLIELIVVLAIFSIILAGATSMMIPVSKIATETDVMASGNVAVNSVSKVLEGNLSTAEYMRVYTGPLSGSIQSEVEDFASTYYGGVLAADSTVAAPRYAAGRFHVLQVNAVTGEMTESIYRVANLNEGSISAALIQDATPVVNEAYYDNYSFEIKPGSYSTVEAFDAVTTLTPSILTSNITPNNISLTIKATTTRSSVGNTKQEYSFVSNASIPMVNQRMGTTTTSVVRGIYYCIDDKQVPDPNDPTNMITQSAIMDRGLSTLSHHTPILARCLIAPVGDGSVYTFIYSYGSEIETN